MAALALLMTACNNDDNISNDQPAEARGIPFTATISTGGSPTRALSGPDGSNVISATWATGEHVALVYKVGDATKVTDATVTAVDNGSGQKMATLTATLDENVTTGTDVTLIYPYSAVDQTEGASYGKVKTDVFAHQLGTVADISTNCDLRQGTGKLTLATGSATLKENVTMDSQIAIWKLSLKKDATTALTATKLDAYFGGMTASATVTGGTSEYYMAVPAGSSGLTFIATAADGSYIYNSTADVTLTASTYYQSTVTLTKQTTRTIASGDGEVTLNDGDVVTGTGGANTQLKIANGATVTLAGLTNNSITKNESIAGIECEGDATIILADGSINKLKGKWSSPAIYIHENKKLTIRGGGVLNADGDDAAGIGGGYYANCGNIVIEGGNITAKGYGLAAGIGGGECGLCGTITISGGTITATGGGEAAGIGSGYAYQAKNTCGDITISGGIINATGGAYAAGIGSGNAYEAENTCGAITISGSAQVTAMGGDEAAGIGSGHANEAQNTCGAITISGSAQVTATGGDEGAGIGSGHAHEAENTCGAITISGGIVEATGGDFAAGIGNGNAHEAENTCGAITISGGTVKAVGKEYAAGIGTGSRNGADKNGVCGAITISGGIVEATGGDFAAGIGSGYYGKFTSISIVSGIISVTATSGGEYYAPIGRGEGFQGTGTEGNVTIDGTAIDGSYNYSPNKWTPPIKTANGNLNWTLSGNTWTLTP